jgi:neutral ceramidase
MHLHAVHVAKFRPEINPTREAPVMLAIHTITLLFGLTLSQPDAGLSVGVAVMDITPPKGFRMSGYFYERFNTGTHDPLQAKALVLRQGNEQAALVFCDLIGISLEVSRRARKLASEVTGILEANMLIAATHSHTGPLYAGALRNYFHDRSAADQGKDPHEAIDYSDLLVKQIVKAIQAAHKSARPSDLRAGIATQQGLSFNRRFHMKDGTVQFNPGRRNPNIVKVAGPIDPDVGLLHFRGPDGKNDLALLSVFAMHLDTVGGTEYSSDYPFYLERTLRKALRRDGLSLFGAGTCGDINHIDVTLAEQLRGQPEAARIGKTLGETVLAALPKLKPQASLNLAVRSRVVQAKLQNYDAEAVVRARGDMAAIGTRKMPFLKQVETYKILSLQLRPGATLPAEVQVFRLSDEVAVVGLPGEVFVELGLAIKKASPFPITLVIELCNDCPGYIPTRKAFQEGSYETVNSQVRSGGGELMVGAAIEMLRELHRRRDP